MSLLRAKRRESPPLATNLVEGIDECSPVTLHDAVLGDSEASKLEFRHVIHTAEGTGAGDAA
jgi:hypothetical protein